MQETKRSNHSLLMREVNDRVFELLSEMGSDDGEFLCECSDEGCMERIHLTVPEYIAWQKAQGRPPLKLAGHSD